MYDNGFVHQVRSQPSAPKPVLNMVWINTHPVQYVLASQSTEYDKVGKGSVSSGGLIIDYEFLQPFLLVFI